MALCARGGQTPPALVNAEAFALGGLSRSRQAVGAVVALFALFRYLTRRAAKPLPPPAHDPLATYREAPAECRRHPLARQASRRRGGLGWEDGNIPDRVALRDPPHGTLRAMSPSRGARQSPTRCAARLGGRGAPCLGTLCVLEAKAVGRPHPLHAHTLDQQATRDQAGELAPAAPVRAKTAGAATHVAEQRGLWRVHRRHVRVAVPL